MGRNRILRYRAQSDRNPGIHKKEAFQGKCRNGAKLFAPFLHLTYHKEHMTPNESTAGRKKRGRRTPCLQRFRAGNVIL